MISDIRCANTKLGACGTSEFSQVYSTLLFKRLSASEACHAPPLAEHDKPFHIVPSLVKCAMEHAIPPLIMEHDTSKCGTLCPTIYCLRINCSLL